MAAYCTVDDVRALMPANIFRIGEDLRATITTGEVQKLIELASQEVDAALSTIYRVPLQPDPSSGRYPAPVPLITAQLTVGLLYDKFFGETGEGRDVSQYVTSLRQQATELLNQILAGQTRLPGQTYWGRRFVRQSLFPAPYAPRGTPRGT